VSDPTGDGIKLLLTQQARKAWVSGLLAFAGPIMVLITATDQTLDMRNVIGSVIAGLVALLATFQTPNAPADVPGDHAVDRAA
jgi:hypothetical protein